MDAKSEVVLRQQHLYSGSILLVNPPQDELAKQLTPLDVHLWTWNFIDFQYFTQNGYQTSFDTVPPEGQFEHVIIFVPKSREQLDYLLDQTVALLGKGKSITLVGEKKAGIERAAKQLQPFGKAIKLDSARHCQLWQLCIDQSITAKPLAQWAKQYQINTPKGEITICALPGVFSQKNLDVGTAVFLPYLQQVTSGKIADFGCGAGVISAYLAKLNPSNRIYALDVDAFALASTKMTFEVNQLTPEQLEVKAVTGIQDAPLFLHAIVSNPPFHQGVNTDYNASETLCKESRRHLKSGGELWIVANRFLNYPILIEQHYKQCTIKTDQQGFKVLFASTQKNSKDE